MARKKRTRLNPRPFFVIAVLLVIAIGGYFILGTGPEEVQYYDFAQCLAEQKATKYGFDACPNCLTQKFIIGQDAFDEHIEQNGEGVYVKCRPEAEAVRPIGDRLDKITVLPQFRDQVTPETTQGELCAMNVALGTPTWVIGDQQVSGWQTIPELAELSGCPLPENFAGETEATGDRITEFN